MVPKLLLSILAGLIAISNCYGQEKTITANWKNVRIGIVIKDIEGQTGLMFFHSIPANAFTVTLSANKAPLSKVLDTIFKTRGYKCDTAPNSISITNPVEKIYTLSGEVINHKNERLPNANVEIKGVKKLQADTFGRFSIKHSNVNVTLIASMSGYDTRKIEIEDETFLTIQLQPDDTLEEVVKYSPRRKRTGDSTSKIPELQTGSVFTLGGIHRNWAPPRTIGGLLNTVSGPLLITPNPNQDWNQPFISIRSRGTIFGYTNPLIILNGLIYSGDFNNINPNDVIEISILKDAASTAKYGVRAGNGVIVIKTRTGEYNNTTKVWVTINTTIGLKPDLFHLPYMSSRDHISTTDLLHQHGYFNDLFLRDPSALIPPAADILHKRDLGLITAADAEAQLNILGNTDIRHEVMKDLFRKSLHQQFHAGVEGGDSTYHYYFSLGYAINKFHLIGNDDRQISMNLDNTFNLGKKGPELKFNFYLSQNMLYNNGIDYNRFLYPYEKLKDANGNALAVTQTVRQAYKESLASSPLLDWNWKPLDEIKFANNKQISYALILTTGLRYQLGPKTELNFSYRYERDIRELANFYSIRTYFNRNLVNLFTQIDAAGNAIRPIPIGDIEDKNTYNRQSSNINAQVKYDAIKSKFSNLTASAGVDIWHSSSRNKLLRLYDKMSNGSSANIDYTIHYPMFNEPVILSTIPQADSYKDTSEYFYSYFANATYTYKKRFAVLFSARKDESNVFGVRANKTGAPFYSTGISYDFSQDRYFLSRLFSQLQIRVSYGSCGNINRSFSALPGIVAIGINPWAVPVSGINNAPNPLLSPETVRISNISLDFILLNNKVWGSAEYYEKESTNLLGIAPNDPTSGVPVFRGNVASMKGNGFELSLNSKTGNKIFQWESSLQASIARDRVTKYYMPESPNYTYTDPRFLNPVVGNPLISMYSLNFAGLDPQTGDPIGILNNFETKNYNELLQSRNFGDLVFHGPATPAFYGSFRNMFTWKRFGLGFTISWKDGYFFRRASIKYEELFTGKTIGHADITRRWQQPGDERYTNIPSLSLPADNARDYFFAYSSALVEKGDHIRLQDIRFSYSLLKNRWGKPIRPTMEAYLYANNVCLLYTANKHRIDPDFANGVPLPLNITVGVKIGF